MISKRFGRKSKGKDNTGRSTKVTSIMISQELKYRLSELKDAYEVCYKETVTYDQMLERWADNVGRFDPKVPGCLETIREERKKEQERLAAGIVITSGQVKGNEAASVPTEPVKEPWELSYLFERNGERVEALPGDIVPFYARINGRNIGMQRMLQNGWSLVDENGYKIEPDQAEEIRAHIKSHEKGI